MNDPNYMSAYDLCILYCEVRDLSQDFDDMKLFLTELIPKRIENHMICSILKEIWVDQSSIQTETRNNANQDNDLQIILLSKIQNTIHDILDDQ